MYVGIVCSMLLSSVSELVCEDWVSFLIMDLHFCFCDTMVDHSRYARDDNRSSILHDVRLVLFYDHSCGDSKRE